METIIKNDRQALILIFGTVTVLFMIHIFTGGLNCDPWDMEGQALQWANDMALKNPKIDCHPYGYMCRADCDISYDSVYGREVDSIICAAPDTWGYSKSQCWLGKK